MTGKCRVAVLGRPRHAHADRGDHRDQPEHEQRRRQPVDRAAQAEDDERADELADEQGRRPDAGAATALLEGEGSSAPRSTSRAAGGTTLPAYFSQAPATDDDPRR
jgi:hypothetical protein